MRSRSAINSAITEPYEAAVRRSARARRLSVTVKPDGTVVVSAPFRASERAILRFLETSAPWVKKTLARVQRKGSELLPLPEGMGTKKHFATHKERARKILRARMEYWRVKLDTDFTGPRIGNQSTRWGSCSKTGTISLNYRLVFLPEELMDYVVVHELCHRLHFNHSKSFWCAVGSALPEYGVLRRTLRRYALN
jgi:predicted metal-dependent hydrolase